MGLGGVLFGRDLAIDLGTTNTRVFLRGRGVVIDEPSVISIDLRTGSLVSAGIAARDAVGRTSPTMTTVRPLRDGVVSDYRATEALLRQFIGDASPGGSLARSRVIVCVAAGSTDVEQRSIEDAAYAAGARCRLLRDAGLADGFWVPEAPAWNGTRAFLNSGDWTLYQNKTDIGKSALNAEMGQVLPIDTDILNPAAGGTIGAFGKDGAVRSYDPARLAAVAGARFWVKPNRLDILDFPEGSPVAHACIARTVHVRAIGPEWSLVDIDEDGVAEGWCRTKDLAPLDRMPAWATGCKPMDI